MSGSAEDIRLFYGPEAAKELEKYNKEWEFATNKEGKENLEKAFREAFHRDKVWYSKKDKVAFRNTNGTVYTGERAPEGMAALEIEGKIYWTEVKEIQALQDYLSLRVQQAEKRDAKLVLANKGIKKVRNKMTHLKSAKKKRK